MHCLLAPWEEANTPPPQPAGNPYRFTGRRLGRESGLYYYRARYYHPALGRFLQTDPIGYDDQMNLYAYVGNDGVNLVDPTGEITEIVTTAPRIHPPSLFGLHTLFSLSFLNSSSRGTDEPKSEGSDATEGQSKCLNAGPINDQAKEALKKYNPISIDQNIEYGGNITKSWFGGYGYDAVRGEYDHTVIPRPRFGSRRVGIWHTHGAEKPGYEANQFSGADVGVARELGVPSYLGTPGGDLMKFDPKTGKIKAYEDLKGHCR